MIWNRDKSACFEGYFLTHVSKYQLQIVYGRDYQLLVRLRPPCREGDNTFESWQYPQCHKKPDGGHLVVTVILSPSWPRLSLVSGWRVLAPDWLIMSQHPSLWSGHVCYIICHDITWCDARLMPSNCSDPVTRSCHNQIVTLSLT